MAAITSPSQVRALGTSLLAAAATFAALALLGTDGAFHRWSGLDLHYLAIPLTLASVFLLLSEVALWGQGTRLASLLTWKTTLAGRQHSLPVLAIAHRLLSDLAWVGLAAGLLASVPELPSTVSAHPSVPDVTSVEPYLRPFDALGTWAILLLMPFVIARAAAVVWTAVGRAFKFPAGHLVAFGFAYVLLVNGGVLSTAFDFPGSIPLLGLGIALGISYVALVLRSVVNAPRSPRTALSIRGSLMLAEVGWVVALLGAVAALPSAVDAVLDEGNRESFAPYLDLSRSLAFWCMAALAPFAIARAVSAFWPTSSQILGFPSGRLALLATVYVMFADNGILPTAFDLRAPQFMAVTAFALVLSYAGSVLRNACIVGLPTSFGSTMVKPAQVTSAAITSIVPAIVVWVTLNNLPGVGQWLLDYSPSPNVSGAYLPFINGLFGVRYAVAALCLAIGIALTLPDALRTSSFRYQFLLAAIGYSVAACLAWLAGSGLSTLGHGYPLAGAIAASGLFTLALAQLARYCVTASNYVLAETCRWVSESKIRGFTLGASVAFYGLLFRPALHDVMWFAAVFEYLAVLALLIIMLVRVRERVWVDADAPGEQPLVWSRWKHHEQRLETKPDSRSEVMATVQRRFVETGDWRPLWIYLMGLLYRNQAPLESAEAVGRRLRMAGFVRANPLLPGDAGRVKARRQAVLAETLDQVEESLSSSSAPLFRVDEASLRRAAEAYVQRGAEPEKLTATLILAHYLRGDNPEEAAAQSFPLLSAPEPSSRWYHPPWVRSHARERERDARARIVEEHITHFFGEAPQPVAEPSPALASAGA